jgi:putative redox protein
MMINASWSADQATTRAQVLGEGFEFQADLDPSAGGSGLAPTPHQLLDAALAACTVLTLQLYSQRKQYPLRSADVNVTHAVVEGVYQITRQVNLLGDLSEQQRADLLRVCNACPIHKTLLGEITINTELAAAEA